MEDHSVFCGECGAKQTMFDSEKTPHDDDVIIPVSNGETRTEKTDGFGTSDWLTVALVVIAFPLIWAEFFLDFMLVMPLSLWWIIFLGLQVAALLLLWGRRKWKNWVKMLATALYVLAYFI